MFSDDMKAAVDSVSEPADPSTFTATNGTRLKLKRVPHMIVLDAAKHLPVPKVPRVFDQDKQRELENPADPDYQRALADYGRQTGELTVNLYLVMGTKVIEVGPEVSPLESDEWVEELCIVYPQADVPVGGPRRRLAWLKYHVLDDVDISEIVQRISVMNGAVREEAVAQARDSFRGEEARDPSGGIHPSGETGRGDQYDPNGRDGSGTGSEGSGGVRALPVGSVDPAF